MLSSLVCAQNTSEIYQTRFPGVTWDNSQWQLTTTTLSQGHYQARMSVANGYHGINVAALGPFFEVDVPVNGDVVNGWPLVNRRQTFATVGGFWDSQPTTNETNYPWLSQYGGDSVISGIPHWAGIVVDLGEDRVLDASTPNSQISNFSSTLDMKQGLMNWAFTWTPHSAPSFQISYQMFAHRLYVNQGLVSMNITAKAAVNATIINVLNGDCAVRTAFSDKGQQDGLIFSAVNPHGIDNVTAYIYAGMTIAGTHVSANGSGDWHQPYVGNNESSIAQHSNVTLAAGQKASVVKFVGIASSDAFTNPDAVARSAALAAMKNGYIVSLQSHVGEWAATFQSGSVDDYSFPENRSLPNDPYIIESAITTVTNPYYLLQQSLTTNAVAAIGGAPINQHSISVSGLASDSYGGQVFWDSEVWMQPGLVAAFPFAARGIANYRVALYRQALANTETAYQSSKKNTNFSSNAAVFPWTSARYGNCTATGPCFDYEYHINGDIGLEFINYWVASGDTDFFRTSLFPIYDSVATFYSEILTKQGSKYALTNMTDPDEYANMVDNGAYTMALISTTLNNANMFRSMFGLPQNSTWQSQAQNVIISRDETVDLTLEYTSMNGSIDVKQADVVLNTYPLDYHGDGYSNRDSLSDLDYYAGLQSPQGPGMTYAIFSIVANQVSPSGCSAFTYQQYSENPYARPPWFQFSEQVIDNYAINGNTHPAFPFLTGHGGANQVVLYGYLGLRYVPDFSLHIDPALPPQIKQIRYRTFYWRGIAISAMSNQTHTTLSRATTSAVSGAQPNATFANTHIPIIVGAGSTTTSYFLPSNGSVTIPNRAYASVQTIPNNVAQCQSVTSTDGTVPGQFPIAAVDGARSTKWQPSTARKNASITVSIQPGLRVKSMILNWGDAPPVNYSITFQNQSSASSMGDPIVVSQANVTITHPYNPNKEGKILPLSDNTTSVTLAGNGQKEVYTGQSATLTIWGTQFNGKGRVKEANGTGATVAEWSIIVESPVSTTDSGLDGGREYKRKTWNVLDNIDNPMLEQRSRIVHRSTRWQRG